jgi:septin family protein
MKEISNLCNLIPIIGKGDKLTDNKAIEELKAKIMNEGKEKYGIQFLELDAVLNKICKNPRRINYLLGGNLQFCPPFLISFDEIDIKNNFLDGYSKSGEFEPTLSDQSDFSRLYYILTCKNYNIYYSFYPF